MKDMTQGSAAKNILLFMFPVLLGNLLQQTYNVVDAAIVGRFLGTGALASVGASSSVQFLVLGFCIGSCMGFGVPVAQHFGGKQLHIMRKYFYNSIFLTIFIAIVMTTLCGVFCGEILHLMSTPRDIYDGAYAYLLVIFLGIPFTLLYNLLASILRAVGDSKTPFIILAISTVINIFLDLFCILILKWGVAGAAIATITSQLLSGLLCLWLIVSRFELLHFHGQEKKLEGAYLGRLLIMAIPMGLQFSITAIGSMVMQAANNSLGSIYVSGFTAAMRIKQFIMCPFDALGSGVSTFCSQNYGAGKYDRVKKGATQGVLLAVGWGIISGAILVFGGGFLTLIFVKSDATEIIAASARYLRTIGMFFWVLGILVVCRMTIQGLGYAVPTLTAGALEMVARTAVSLLLVPTLGFTAICCADPTAWFAGCLFVVPMCIWSIRKNPALQDSKKRL